MGTTHFFRHSKNDDFDGPIGAPILRHTAPRGMFAAAALKSVGSSICCWIPRRSESLLCGASICREGCQENDGDCQAWCELHRTMSCRTIGTAD